MTAGSRIRLACIAAALVAAASTAGAQSSGCWRSADCRNAPLPANPSGDFRYEAGRAPGTDFRSTSRELAGDGPRRLDGEPVTEAERHLLQPQNMRFRQYTAPTWPNGGTDGATDRPANAYGQ